MKRTNHAHFVAIGRESKPIVDKPDVHGATFRQDVIDRELLGIAPTYSCTACNVTLGERAKFSHLRSKNHQKNMKEKVA